MLSSIMSRTFSMDFTGYEHARDTIIRLAPLIETGLGVVALATLLAAVRSRWDRFSRYATVLLVSCQSAGVALLVWFHLKIAESIQVFNPFDPTAPSEVLAVPLWIEGEKLYFWAFLYGCFVLAFRTSDQRLTRALRVSLAAFVATALIVDGPFRQPLPLLHRELTEYAQANAFGGMPWIQAAAGMYGRAVGYYGSPFMWIHPPLLFLGYAALLAGTVILIVVALKSIPELENDAYRSIRLGYLALTAGMFVGYPWAVTAWQGESWWWSPKINVSIIMWLLYTAYLHGRLALRRRNMYPLTLLLAFLAFATLCFTYLTTYIAPGVHSYR